jgi:hypothetical protein
MITFNSPYISPESNKGVLINGHLTVQALPEAGRFEPVCDDIFTLYMMDDLLGCISIGWTTSEWWWQARMRRFL